MLNLHRFLVKIIGRQVSKTKSNKSSSSNNNDDNQKTENNWIPAWLPPSTSQMSIIANRIWVFYRWKRANFLQNNNKTIELQGFSAKSHEIVS